MTTNAMTASAVNAAETTRKDPNAALTARIVVRHAARRARRARSLTSRAKMAARTRTGTT